jgi:hypothetical protein
MVHPSPSPFPPGADLFAKDVLGRLPNAVASTAEIRRLLDQAYADALQHRTGQEQWMVVDFPDDTDGTAAEPADVDSESAPTSPRRHLRPTSASHRRAKSAGYSPSVSGSGACHRHSVR